MSLTPREFGGGQLLNWGPHIIDQSLRLLGSPRHSLSIGSGATGGEKYCFSLLCLRLTSMNGSSYALSFS